VKWGKKYGADYVNKLYYGVKRNTTKNFKFYCYTDDPTGLHKEILVVPLKESWGGWWGKATLFSKGNDDSIKFICKRFLCRIWNSRKKSLY